MVLALKFNFIYLETWWQDKLYHTHLWNKPSSGFIELLNSIRSAINPRLPMPLSLGARAIYNIDIKIHVFHHCNLYIQIFSVHIGDYFFIERFADWHECQIYRPVLSNTVIVYQYGLFFKNISLGFVGYVYEIGKKFLLAAREFLRVNCKPI